MSDTYQVSVRLLTGEIINLQVEQDERFHEFKQKLADRINWDTQRMMFNKKSLAYGEYDTLVDRGVTKDSIIYIVRQLNPC